MTASGVQNCIIVHQLHSAQSNKYGIPSYLNGVAPSLTCIRRYGCRNLVFHVQIPDLTDHSSNTDIQTKRARSSRPDKLDPSFAKDFHDLVFKETFLKDQSKHMIQNLMIKYSSNCINFMDTHRTKVKRP